MKTLALALTLAAAGYALPTYASDATVERSLARRSADRAAVVASPANDDPCAACCPRAPAPLPGASARREPGHR